MKNYILILALLFSITKLSAQNTLINEILEEEDRFDQNIEPNDHDELVTLIDIWVRDSTDYLFPDESGDFVLDTRDKILTRDVLGSPLTRKLIQWSPEEQRFYNLSTSTNSYYPEAGIFFQYSFPWNSSIEEWAADTLTYKLKDEDGNTIDQFTRIWDYDLNEFDMAEYSNRRKISTYNSDGKKTNETTFRFDFTTNMWTPKSRVLYTYAPDYLSYDVIGQNWDQDSNIWVDDTKKSYTLSESQLIIEKIEAGADANGGWVNFYRRTYEYNENDDRISYLVEVNTGQDEWTNHLLTTYTYDANANKTQTLIQEFNEQGAWVNKKLRTYEYDAYNNTISSLYQNADSSDWVNDKKYTYTYNENNQTLSRLQQRWDEDSNDWNNYTLYDYSYDEFYNATAIVSLLWDNDTNDWRNLSKRIYYWSQFEILNIDNVLSQKTIISPNPTTGLISIKGIDNIEKSTATLFSVSGQYQMSQPLTENTIDISALPNGVYFLQLKTPEGIAVKKVVKF